MGMLSPTDFALAKWLLTEGKALPRLDELVDALCTQLRALGIPVDRAIVSTRTLHAVYLSYFRIWRSDGNSVSDTYDRDEENMGYFERSPIRVVMETGRPVELLLEETADDAFGIVPDLKADGYVHYLCAPLRFSDGTLNHLSFATKAPGGFRPDHIATLLQMEPALASALEIRMLRRAMVDTLQTYLGDEPGRRVAQGDIVRGQVSEIEAAILFADLRGFTANSMQLGNTTLVQWLNAYYACIVPAVEQHGGDVLKLIGDGVLAIFPEREGDAPQRALAAARDAQAAIALANGQGLDWPRLNVGIALHAGTAAYGNVGSLQRLDFTVIGRDVNLASRISAVCRDTGEPILMSKRFRDRLGREAYRLGPYALPGVPDRVNVYRPFDDV